MVELLDRHGLSPSRALGQNFLCDPGTVDRIVRLAGVGPGTRVVEIGPGLGSLTVGLVEAGARVVAVEVDRYLLPALAETVEDLDVKIVHADARHVDWGDHLEPGSWTVVANLPYNIATPLVLDLLAAEPRFVRWLVMVQREAGERLVAGPGSRTYGIPSVLAAYWARSRIAGRVPAQLFLPRPNVESVLVELVRHDGPPVDAPFDELAPVVRAGFGQRRKMVRRSLAAFLDADAIARAGVDPTARAEDLDLLAWSALTLAAHPDPGPDPGPDPRRCPLG
ncbi:MAG: 16S rRNA (adenine(1518)-N(6)/adenine(1519)-N(6))-dimethyltransferase RsmA [Acidimicrobiales bacterium]